MNILILGDSHTYGLGLPAGQLSYVGHFIRQISRTGRAVSVEAYAHQTMEQIRTTLTRLPLNRYDLILLQVNPNWRSDETVSTAHSLPANWLPSHQLPVMPKAIQPGWFNRLKAKVSVLWTDGTGLFNKPPFGLRSLLDFVHPYRHNVLLISPFPCTDPRRHQMGQRARGILLHEADRQLFSVFDSNAVVLPRDEYFLNKTSSQLNGVSHELIGLALYDFYQSAPTIITVQSVKRR